MLAIQIDSVVKTFPAAKGGQTTAVDHVSLHIPAGSLFFLLGPSGCGKTTLLRMIAGFVLPTSGQILFDGKDISHVPPHRRDTGMVFQSYALWPHMTIAANVGFGLDARKIPRAEKERRIDEALAMVQMQGLKERRPNQLSGGQQQRVALARALAIRPRCLLLDEPLSNLDAQLRLEMRAEIRRIVKQAGLTAIYVTHDQKEALSMADGIAVMNAGKLEQTGTPEAIYRHPATRFAAGFIGESNFLHGTIDSVIGSALLIKTAAGPLMATAPAGKILAAGKAVSVAFRPEAVRLGDGGGVKVNRLRGKRLSSTYLGDMAEHLVQVPGMEKPVKAFEMNPRAGAAPAEMTLEIAAEQVMVVDDPA